MTNSQNNNEKSISTESKKNINIKQKQKKINQRSNLNQVSTFDQDYTAHDIFAF